MDLFWPGQLGIFTFVRYGIIIFLLVYTIFAAIVVKQVKVMTDTLSVGFEKPIKFIAFLHFFGSVFAFFVSIFVL